MRWVSPSNPYVLPMTVIADDIDDQGIANNVSILGWMVRASVAHSVAAGYDWVAYRKLGAMFVVRRHEIDYHRPAVLGDELLLTTWTSFMKAATSHRHHEIIRPRDGAVIARGINVWAFVDSSSGKPLRMPPAVLDAFDPAGFVFDRDPGDEA